MFFIGACLNYMLIALWLPAVKFPCEHNNCKSS